MDLAGGDVHEDLLPEPREHHSVCALPGGHGLVIFGGRTARVESSSSSDEEEDYARGQFFSDLWLFRLSGHTAATGRWQRVWTRGEDPAPRCSHDGELPQRDTPSPASTCRGGALRACRDF